MVVLRQKVDVSGGDDADQLAAHLAGLCYRDPRETVASLGLKHVPHCVSRTHHHRISDKALLKFLARTKIQVLNDESPFSVYCFHLIVSHITLSCVCQLSPSYLDFAHLVGLELSSTVMMNYSNPTHQLKPANQRHERK